MNIGTEYDTADCVVRTDLVQRLLPQSLQQEVLA